MLLAKGLVRKYGDLTAVDGVSFEVAKGTCFGLLGPNGAGKTSTIGLLVGLAKPDEGEVRLDGDVLLPEAYSVKRRIGYVPQEIALYDELSAVANLEFFGGLYGLSGNERETRIGKVLEISGLTDRSKERVRNYSGGMKRRLNLAASLMHAPDVLVLDEPTVGVDPQSRNAIFDALRALRDDGTTLVYTTHYMEEVERLCDRIAIMDAGRIMAEDDLQGLYRLLPGRNSLTIGLENNNEATAFVARLKAAGLDGVVSGATVEVMADDLPRALEAVATSAKVNPVESVQTHRSTLEEVFLHLTGKSLRD